MPTAERSPSGDFRVFGYSYVPPTPFLVERLGAV